MSLLEALRGCSKAATVGEEFSRRLKVQSSIERLKDDVQETRWELAEEFEEIIGGIPDKGSGKPMRIRKALVYALARMLEADNMLPLVRTGVQLGVAALNPEVRDQMPKVLATVTKTISEDIVQLQQREELMQDGPIKLNELSPETEKALIKLGLLVLHKDALQRMLAEVTARERLN